MNLGCILNFSLLGYVEVGFLKRYLILAVQGGYIDVQEGYMLFRWVIWTDDI